MDLTILWVVLIVIVGITIGIYSMCKGCAGLNQRQQTVTARMLIAPYSAMMQQLRAQEASRNRMFLISGAAVGDPPSYDELFAPPPPYEETIKALLNLQEKCEGPQTTQQAGATCPDLAADDSFMIEVEKEPNVADCSQTAAECSQSKQTLSAVLQPLADVTGATGEQLDSRLTSVVCDNRKEGTIGPEGSAVSCNLNCEV